MKEDMSLSNLGTVAFHAAKVPTNVFSSTLICILTLDYIKNLFWSNFDIQSAGVTLKIRSRSPNTNQLLTIS